MEEYVNLLMDMSHCHMSQTILLKQWNMKQMTQNHDFSQKNWVSEWKGNKKQVFILYYAYFFVSLHLLIKVKGKDESFNKNRLPLWGTKERISW